MKWGKVQPCIMVLFSLMANINIASAQSGGCPYTNYEACAATSLQENINCSISIAGSSLCDSDGKVWYRYMGQSSTVHIEISNLGGATNNLVFILVYAGDCNNLTTADEVAGDFGSVSFSPIAGVEYFFFVRPTFAADFSVCLSACQAAQNDDICDPNLPILVESISCNPISGSSFCSQDKLVFYSFVPLQTSRYIFESQNQLDGLPNGIRIYQDVCSSADELGYGLAPIQINLVQGQTYTIGVETYDSNYTPIYADFDLCVYAAVCSNTVIPPNDICNNATELNVDPTTSCVTSMLQHYSCATASGLIPADCAQYGQGGDVWFRAIVPNSGHLIVSTLEHGDDNGLLEFDMVLEAYSGDCNNLTLLECDDDGVAENSLHARLDLDGLTIGATIYIRAYSFYNFPIGYFEICARDGQPADCPTELVLAGNVIEGTSFSYSANEKISSEQHVIGTASNIVYTAGLEIELLPEFEVVLGSYFLATIEACN